MRVLLQLLAEEGEMNVAARLLNNLYSVLTELDLFQVISHNLLQN